MKTTSLATICLVFLAGLLTTNAPDDKNSQDKPASQNKTADAETEPAEISDLNEKLIGAWVRLKAPEDQDLPAYVKAFKFRGEKHWAFTSIDTRDGRVLYHQGGTYTIEGDDYVETCTFAAPGTQYLLGNSYRYTVSLKDGVCQQDGVDNPFSETWKRLER